MKVNLILVLDFGGQYCHLIARRIRENGVYSEIVAHDVSPTEIEQWRKKMRVTGLVLSGGPQSVFDESAPRINPEILDLGVPVLVLIRKTIDGIAMAHPHLLRTA
jgi:GMP synthase (glutamine-hydrolysing)